MRVLGVEVFSVSLDPQSGSGALSAPEESGAEPGGDAVVQDFSDTSGGGDVVVDPAIPFGFAEEVLAMPSTVLQPSEDDEEDDTCQSRPPLRIGF